ncbi:hypothetical protein AVEN_275405-1 [Araneus ventricosus]|uniref:Uncharacterized protein n=1 Tax=Araneus ventricosus TaxID=182803 RepID=A0A4Y2PJK4_ARAVE|nr:hypothetical protein AVEN_275405-1 [Araneus ventricosus]
MDMGHLVVTVDDRDEILLQTFIQPQRDDVFPDGFNEATFSGIFHMILSQGHCPSLQSLNSNYPSLQSLNSNYPSLQSLNSN